MKNIAFSIGVVILSYFAIRFLSHEMIRGAIDDGTPTPMEENTRPERGDSSVPKPGGKLATSDKISLALESLDAGIAKVVSTSTPEIRAEVRKSHLDKYKRAYADFFSSLALDKGEIDRAVDIILERESAYLDAIDTLHRTGFTKGGGQFAEKRKVEQALAEVQLHRLLGPLRYEDLAKFEKEHRARISTNAGKIVFKHED